MNLIGRRYGHIRVERMLGHGGMGDVYEGLDEKLSRRVALKVLQHPASQRLDDEARTRMAREARTLGRLDHPNICRIYDFIDDEEVDILVLELIDGRTLLAALRDDLSTHAKLRIAQSIADVLVAAHRAGIVHRDLKPENVMLTKSGEVKVLDFGLARWLERERRSGKNLATAPAADSDFDSDDVDATAVIKAAAPPEFAVDATAAGITVGTPLYMSPEQARGESLTTASDIYSFGLVLQTLFTGRDPYPDGLAAREVMLKAARGESLPVNGGAPRGVAALIKAMKAFAPADRPTAADTLRRIRHIVDTPKRYARRALMVFLLVAVALAGWKYVTDLRRERAAAQQAEAEARRRRAQAEALIGFMLGDLRTKLEPVGRLDILDDVAERSLAYMSSLDPKSLSAEELGRNSKALYQLGEVRIAQGRLRDATAVLNKSLVLASEAATREPLNEKLQLELGSAHFWVGNAAQTAGDLPAALQHYRAYLDIAERLGSLHPTNGTYQLERAYAHGNVGTILELQGHLAEALEHYDTALALKRQRLRDSPGDGQLQADLALTINKIGYAQYKFGELAAAQQQFDAEVAAWSQLVTADPKQARWKERLAIAHSFRARVLTDTGNIDEAARALDEEASIEQSLVALDATNTVWAKNLANTTVKIADLMRSRGKVAESLPLFERAAASVSELLKRDAQRTAWKRDLAFIEARYARALAAAHRIDEAERKARTAAAALQALPPSDDLVRFYGASADLIAGDIEAKRGDHEGAVMFWREADALLKSAHQHRDLLLLEGELHAALRLGRRDDAHAIAARLQLMGDKSPEFVTLCNEGC